MSAPAIQQAIVPTPTPAPAPAPAPGTTPAPSRWILSPLSDLIWFQGSALAGVALLVFFVVAPPVVAAPIATQPALLALLLWGILFDGTHVVGTYARSYFAPEPGARDGLPGAWSLALFAIGPAAAVADWAMGGAVFPAFLQAALLWAYYHLVRQHWGFVALYRRRAPGDPTPARLDEAILWLGCLYPFVRFSLTPAFAASGLPQLLPAAATATLRHVLDVAVALAAVGLAVAWVRRGGARALGPKHAFMAIVIAFHLATFALLENLLEITATLTIFHNLQYHRIVWQHEAGKGRRPLGGLVPYLAAGLGLGAIWYGPRVLGAHLAGPGLVRNVILGVGWGVAFHHYLVDARIWRLRRAPAVARAIDNGAVRRVS
jgi:hypothetical protein